MSAYHVTTPKKLERYQRTGYIMSPVRWWTTEYSARRWMNRTGRTVILLLDAPKGWPLPVHGGARWTDQIVRTWKELENPMQRSILTESEQQQYHNEPTFRAWANYVEQALTVGMISLTEIVEATRVGMTNYALKNLPPYYSFKIPPIEKEK